MRDGNDDLNPEKSFMNFFLWFASATLSGITALQHSPYLMNPYNFFIYSNLNLTLSIILAGNSNCSENTLI